MVWIPIVIFAVSSLSKMIFKSVSKNSFDPEVKRKAEIAADISEAVAEVSSFFIPVKSPVKKPPIHI